MSIDKRVITFRCDLCYDKVTMTCMSSDDFPSDWELHMDKHYCEKCLRKLRRKHE